MELELMGLIDNILRITYRIYNCYEKLIYLECNKDYLDYKNKLAKEIKTLKELKKEENNAYYEFRNSLPYTVKTLSHIENHLKSGLEDKDLYCISRVFTTLNMISYELFLENMEMLPDNIIKLEVQNHLTSLGFDSDETKKVMFEIIPFVEESVSGAIYNLNDNYNKTIKSNFKINYLKKKYLTAFKKGALIEDDLIENNFEKWKSNLKNQMKDVLSIDDSAKQKLLSLMLAPAVRETIADFMNEDDPERLDELRTIFVAYMLHLDYLDLQTYYGLISSLSIMFNFNANVLLEEINKVIYSRKYNKNEEGKTL